MAIESSEKLAKHERIYKSIFGDILHGKYPEGTRFPTEQELVQQFSASRPTVRRALRELEQNGLIYRRQGVGTFVRKPDQVRGQKLGLLVPGVVIESDSPFGRMVLQMSRMSADSGHVLVLNDVGGASEDETIADVERICAQFLDFQLSGVFFMPLELPPEKMHVNQQITDAFDKAGVAICLLDRDIHDCLHRSKYDLVGISHERAAAVMTMHLLEGGARKIDFVAGPTESSAVSERITGYQQALIRFGISPEAHRIHHVDLEVMHHVPHETKVAFVDRMMSENEPDAVICVNDLTATSLMLTMLTMGLRIPQDVRLVGFDDLPLLATLPVRLTTVRQPAETLAREAVRTLLDRMESPELPARDIVVDTQLVVRDSCGFKMSRGEQRPIREIAAPGRSQCDRTLSGE